MRAAGGPANVTLSQHGHERPGSAHSVTFRMNSTSMTCAHREPAAAAPSRDAPQERHSSTQPGAIIRHGLIGHAPQAPAPATARQIDKRRNQPGPR
jgi:hypothetical protein